MPFGVYISVPFCRAKCTYCNFVSGVFSAAQMGRYVNRLAQDIAACRDFARRQGAEIPPSADSIYLGGGTPSLLQPKELKNLFFILRNEFDVVADAEVTVECAPGTLTDEILETLAACGVSRVSLGVQSFVDREAASVGRLHTRDMVGNDIAHLRAAGIGNINIDLIAGLPHQTRERWDDSLDRARDCGVPHVSIYMLEVDEDSRLGRELIAGGTKYHAHFVPDEDATAEFYEVACARLEAAGMNQYEISNFAQPGVESRHNLKYWTRQPYLGFGVDAHSMLPAGDALRAKGIESVRFAATDSFDQFFASPGIKVEPVTFLKAVEESFFLGLRLNRGISLDEIHKRCGPDAERFSPAIEESAAEGLLTRSGGQLRLTPRGRLLSNEVFAGFIGAGDAPPFLDPVFDHPPSR